jgi:hypothetical protein
MLNFEDYLCKEYAEKGVKSVELRVYYTLAPESLYASSMKLIKDNKIVWGQWDNMHLPKEAQDHCDRIIKLAVFA